MLLLYIGDFMNVFLWEHQWINKQLKVGFVAFHVIEVKPILTGQNIQNDMEQFTNIFTISGLLKQSQERFSETWLI